ncbi:MAG: nucleoside 2-deoxyribosyltransferase [Anaerolineales bacterium]|nr:nucleoside 2-deoxyribosyltransferase [Anaerolineales bacterium]
MNVYFACSITGGRQDAGVYQIIVDAMQAAGHEVPTALLACEKVVDLEIVVEPEEVYTRDVAWIDDSDALVAEVSTPSHGAGYEIAHALRKGKPVLCVHRAGVLVSKMLTGNTHANISIRAYQSDAEAARIVIDFLKALED